MASQKLDNRCRHGVIIQAGVCFCCRCRYGVQQEETVKEWDLVDDLNLSTGYKLVKGYSLLKD